MTADSPASPHSSNKFVPGLQPQAFYLERTTGTAATAPRYHKSIGKPVQNEAKAPPPGKKIITTRSGPPLVFLVQEYEFQEKVAGAAATVVTTGFDTTIIILIRYNNI